MSLRVCVVHLRARTVDKVGRQGTSLVSADRWNRNNAGVSHIWGHKESLWWCRFAACSNGFRRCMATVQRCQPPKHKHEPTIWLCYRRICTLSKQASYASTELNSNFCFWLRLLYWTDSQTLSTNFQHIWTKQTLTTQGALFALSFGVCVLVVTISLSRGQRCSFSLKLFRL